jgi:dolichol kinase
MDGNGEATVIGTKPRTTSEEVRIEILRKSIHLLIALVPTLAWISAPATIALLAAGILVYSVCELLRMKGVQVPLVSRVTSRAARRRDAGKFVRGPITLGLGALLALLLFPFEAAAIAIYALAFGDGLSSLVGKLLGRIRLPLTGGKSLEGSLTCFTAVFIASSLVSRDPLGSLGVAAVAMVTEAAPLKDFDNIILPLVAGAAALFFLHI